MRQLVSSNFPVNKKEFTPIYTWANPDEIVQHEGGQFTKKSYFTFSK